MSEVKGYCETCDKKYGYGTGCPICNTPLELVQLKNPLSYSKDVANAISTISIDKGQSSPFGSFIFRAQTYPSDIDVIEKVVDCCSEEKVFMKMKDILVKLVRRVDFTPNYYFSEIKVGYDLIYKIDIGYKYGNKIEGYDSNYINSIIETLYIGGYLTKEEYSMLGKLVVPNISRDNWDELSEFLRQKYTIRWTRKEVLAGYKFLIGGRRITLLDAIKQKTVVKIDVIALINDRFIEITNFFILVVGSNMINFKFDYNNQIKDEIDKFFSKKFWKPYKGAKRMWGLSRYNENYDYLYKLTPLMQSGIANFNQIASEIDTLLLMINIIKDLPIKLMMKQIEGFKTRLSNVDDVKFDDDMVYKKIDSILEEKSISKIHDLLESLYKYFKEIIGRDTIGYLKYVGLYPLPDFFLK